jgi:hypothetical protein
MKKLSKLMEAEIRIQEEEELLPLLVLGLLAHAPVLIASGTGR